MIIGTSLFAIALGAILKFAVNSNVGGVSLGIIGVILMVIGGLGLTIGLWMYASGRGSADHSY